MKVIAGRKPKSINGNHDPLARQNIGNETIAWIQPRSQSHFFFFFISAEFPPNAALDIEKVLIERKIRVSKKKKKYIYVQFGARQKRKVIGRICIPFVAFLSFIKIFMCLYIKQYPALNINHFCLFLRKAQTNTCRKTRQHNQQDQRDQRKGHHVQRYASARIRPSATEDGAAKRRISPAVAANAASYVATQIYE